MIALILGVVAFAVIVYPMGKDNPQRKPML